MVSEAPYICGLLQWPRGCIGLLTEPSPDEFAVGRSGGRLYRSRPEITLTRSASEVDKFFPRLRSLELRAAPFAGKWT